MGYIVKYQGKAVKHNGKVVTANPYTEPEIQAVTFFGSDISALTRLDYAATTITFTTVLGLLIFAEPVANPIRTEWVVNEWHKGPINGTSLFNVPVQMVIQGVLCWVYVSMYELITSEPITFR